MGVSPHTLNRAKNYRAKFAYHTTHDSVSKPPAVARQRLPQSRSLVTHLLAFKTLALRLFSYRGANAIPVRGSRRSLGVCLRRPESQIDYLSSSQPADHGAAATASRAFRGLVGRPPQAIRQSWDSGLSDR